MSGAYTYPRNSLPNEVKTEIEGMLKAKDGRIVKAVLGVDYINEAGGGTGQPGEGLVVERIAGQNLSALRVVAVNMTSGRVHYADKDNASLIYNIAGVTITSAQSLSTVKVRTKGFMSDSSWNWDEGGNPSLFLGSNGVITQGLTAGNFSMKIGFVARSNEIYINLFEPIRR